MHDQVSELREIASKAKAENKIRVVSVTSGKGGVGKTNFTVNLALALAEYKQRVMILDGDMGLANVDLAFGLSAKYTMEHLLAGEKTIEQILLTGPQDIGIIPGGAGVQDLANLNDRHKLAHVIANLGRLERMTDLLLIDTGAGIGHTVMNFLKAADDVIILTTPEPTALTDAYGLLKTLRQESGEAEIHVVVNRVQNEAAAREAFARLEMVVDRFLNGSLDLMGWVYDDPLVGRSVMRQEPLGLCFPQSPAYKCIQWIAASLVGIYYNPPQEAGGIRKFLSKLLGFA